MTTYKIFNVIGKFLRIRGLLFRGRNRLTVKAFLDISAVTNIPPTQVIPQLDLANGKCLKNIRRFLLKQNCFRKQRQIPLLLQLAKLNFFLVSNHILQGQRNQHCLYFSSYKEV